MFWYQCRYCKVNFDQWEKLVTHRRDEHRQEFEALKRRSALHLKKQEEAVTANKQRLLENGENSPNITVKTPSRFTRKMKPTTATSTSSTFLSTLTSPSRRSNQHSSSKELDAKNLENQEISLCIPSSSTLRPSSAISGFNRSSTPPYTFPTPISSPRLNGNHTPYSRGKTACNGNISHQTTSSLASSSFLTPPGTPSRLSSCPLMSAEELVLNMNWSPPADLRKAVHFHQMNDEDEIEICVIPTTGSCISVTKHSLRRSGISSRPRPPPPYKNGCAGSKIGSIHSVDNRSNKEDQQVGHQQQKTQQLNNNHVMIENLEDELRMTCSNDHSNQISVKNQPVTIQNVRRRSHDEMMRSTGRRLKRLHSRLQLRQYLQRTGPLITSSALTRRSSRSILPESRGDNQISTNKIIRNSSRNRPNSNEINASGIRSGRLGRSRSSNTSTNDPRLLRLTTTASSRRPK